MFTNSLISDKIRVYITIFLHEQGLRAQIIQDILPSIDKTLEDHFLLDSSPESCVMKISSIIAFHVCEHIREDNKYSCSQFMVGIARLL